MNCELLLPPPSSSNPHPHPLGSLSLHAVSFLPFCSHPFRCPSVLPLSSLVFLAPSLTLFPQSLPLPVSVSAFLFPFPLPLLILLFPHKHSLLSSSPLPILMSPVPRPPAPPPPASQLSSPRTEVLPFASPPMLHQTALNLSSVSPPSPPPPPPPLSEGDALELAAGAAPKDGP